VTGWVLDSSVVAKWFLNEEGSEAAMDYFDALMAGEANAAVPSSLFGEIASLLWTRRRDVMDRETALASLRDLMKIPFEVTEVQGLLPTSLEVAYDLEISPYDAVFVVLAEQLGRELVTADRRLWTRTRRVATVRRI
jgi:predicted nucleic acid-binding protein